MLFTKMMVFLSKMRSRAVVVLAGILFFHFLNNLIWLRLDNTYLLYESAHHFLFSLKVFESLRQSHVPWLSDIYNTLGNTYRWHGVFTQYVTAPFYFIFGASQDSGVLVSGTISLAVLAGAVFGIGKILYDEVTGYLAAFLVSMYPLVFTQSRIYMLDLPLTAVVALAVMFLLKSDGFSNVKYTVFFALASGAGLLIKFNFILFLIGPFCWTLYVGLRNEKNKHIKKNLMLVFFLAVLIAGMFYKLKIESILTRVYESSWFYAVRYFPGYSLFHIVSRGELILFRWFYKDFILNSVSLFLFVFFLSGVFSRKCGKTVLWVWFFVPVFVFLFFCLPGISRYYMPFLPVFALMSSAGIMVTGNVRIKRFLIIFVIIAACFQFYTLSYGIDLVPKNKQVRSLPESRREQAPYSTFNRENSLFSYRSDHGDTLGPVKAVPCNEDLLNAIMKDLGEGRDGGRVLVIGNNLQVYEELVYEGAIRGLPLEFKVISMAAEPMFLRNEVDSPTQFKMSEYVIVVNDPRNNTNLPTVVQQRMVEASGFLEKNIGSFDLINEFVDRSGVRFSLYRKKWVSIRSEDLEVSFRSGYFRIFDKHHEIGGGRFIDIGFHMDGRWYNFLDFPWEAGESGPGELVLNMADSNSLLSGRVSLQIMDGYNIRWAFKLNAKIIKQLNDFDFRIGVPRGYTHWQCSLKKEKFPLIEEDGPRTLKLVDPKVDMIIVSGPEDDRRSEIVFSVDPAGNMIPCVGQRGGSRMVGFYKKEVTLSPDIGRTFTGVVCFTGKTLKALGQ